jgi:hypothetical protein
VVKYHYLGPDDFHHARPDRAPQPAGRAHEHELSESRLRALVDGGARIELVDGGDIPETKTELREERQNALEAALREREAAARHDTAEEAEDNTEDE